MRRARPANRALPIMRCSRRGEGGPVAASTCASPRGTECWSLLNAHVQCSTHSRCASRNAFVPTPQWLPQGAPPRHARHDDAHIVGDGPARAPQGFRRQTAAWPAQPVDVAAAWLARLPAAAVVADFGAGDAALAGSARQRVHSFDLVAGAPGVVACNMAHTPLGAGRPNHAPPQK